MGWIDNAASPSHLKEAERRINPAITSHESSSMSYARLDSWRMPHGGHYTPGSKRNDAEKTKWADLPSGCNRQRGAHGADRDRRVSGHRCDATGEVRKQFGGVEVTSREHGASASSGESGANSQRGVRMMKHIRKNSPSKPARQAAEPREIRAGRFLDYVLEMYAPPSSVKLRSVVNGRAGVAQDKVRIRGYYKSALENALGRKD